MLQKLFSSVKLLVIGEIDTFCSILTTFLNVKLTFYLSFLDGFSAFRGAFEELSLLYSSKQTNKVIPSKMHRKAKTGSGNWIYHTWKAKQKFFQIKYFKLTLELSLEGKK
jgi:hypothetical protein